MDINDASLEDLSMLQLSDSFFPSGLYTTSSGLEALYYSTRKITKADDLYELIKVYLEHQIGPADCTALGNSYEQAQRKDLKKLVEVDNLLFSMKLIEEVRNASVRSGTQILRCVGSFITDNDILNQYQREISERRASGVYPVAFAITNYALGIPRHKAALMMLYGFSVSMIGAALRLGILQHFDGQKIIHTLKPTILESVRNNINRPLAGMWQFAPDIDLIQISHECMSSKMFIT
jgi:urease accessory protein